MTSNKYGAIKTTIDGITFDSKHEASRYCELVLLQRGNAISDLQMQVPFPVVVNSKKICTYIADFQYVDVKSGKAITEDAKSTPTKTPVYRIKKKLVEALYGIKIIEV